MAAIRFYLNKGSVYALYSQQKQGRRIRLEYYPGIVLSDVEKQWDTKTNLPKDATIDKDLTKIKNAIYDLLNIVDPFDLDNDRFSKLIREKTSGEKVTQTSFFDYADMFISQSKKEKGHEFANSFRTVINKLSEFDSKLTFERIDKMFYRNFKTWLEKQGHSKNYIGSMIRDLKRILNRATDDDINTNTTFEKFSVDSEDVYNIYLSEKEIEKIYNLEISDDDIIALQKEENENAFIS